MTEKTLTLTIVIPVYNEENYLEACLNSIQNQVEKPDEVIVVDNNSTDRTVEIAKSYGFVKVLHEKRQHQVFAQATGFNAAKSYILGRIDADTILPPNWTKKVKAAFADSKIIAVTGGAVPYDVPLEKVGIGLFNWFLFMVSIIAGHRMLWGSNCAFRKTAWLKIKNKLLMRGDIWEDYDLAFCLKKYGRIKYLRDLKIGASFRSVHTNFINHIQYQFRAVRTFYFRANFCRLTLFIILWTTTIIVYPLAAADNFILNSRGSKPKP